MSRWFVIVLHVLLLVVIALVLFGKFSLAAAVLGGATVLFFADEAVSIRCEQKQC